MSTQITQSKTIRIKEADFSNTITIKRRGQGDIVLPLSANDNKKQLQIRVAELQAIANEFDEAFREKIKTKEISPLQLKQRAETEQLIQNMAREAYKDDEDGGPDEKDNLDNLIGMAVGAGIKLQKEKEAIKKKNQPIDVDAEDVDE